MDRAAIESRIEDAIREAEATVTYPRPNDTDHLAVRVVSPAFAETSLIEQHDMVREAVGDALTRDIHALKITTRTPDADQ